MDIALIKMSSKGQIVIPKELRSKLGAGEKLVIIREGDRLLIKRASDMTKALREDLEFARRTEEAWQQYGQGQFKSLKKADFLRELKKW